MKNFKHAHNGNPERITERERAEKISDEIITKHLSELMKQLTQSGSSIYSKRSTHRHIIVKLMKTKTKRKY